MAKYLSSADTTLKASKPGNARKFIDDGKGLCPIGALLGVA